MEHAKWQGKIICAGEIAKKFEKEQEVRKASRRKELTCPDEECNGTVKYCHGEKKGAYFAHLTNYNCDYHIFDSNDNHYFRAIRRKLQAHFLELGLSVEIEKKVIPHHYAHFVITDIDKKVVAVELGTKNTSAYAIEYLQNEYAAEKINVRWLVVGDIIQKFKEEDLFWLKRYLVNKTSSRDFIMIDWNGDKVCQCRWDSKKYEYNGRSVKLGNYTELYSDWADIDALVFENGEFTLVGFNDRYEKWLIEKEKRIMAYAQEMEASIKANEYIHAVRRDYPIVMQSSNKALSYDQRRAEILPLMEQREHQVSDSSGKKWFYCEKCGKIDEENEFVIMNRNNTGSCRDCMIPKH